MLNTQASKKSTVFYALAAIFILSLFVRFATAEYLDIGGDNAAKWLWAKFLVQGIPFDRWYQQTIRWPILFPLAGLIKAFGYNPVLTYVLPILFSSLATAGICWIGIRLHSLRLGLTAASLTMLFPQMAQTGSQLWPGVFELTYLTFCVIALLCWLDSRRMACLILGALFFFLAWGSRVTIIYAYPGLVLLLWLPKRDFRAPVIFSLFIGLFIGVEWGAFWALTGNPMGRIGIIKATHLVTAGLKISWTDYLLNIKQLTKLKGLIAVWVLCMGAAVMHIGSRDRRWQAFGWLYIFYALLLLYMVSSLSPLKLAMPVGTRFWGVIAPFGLLLLAHSLLKIKESSPQTGKILLAILFLVFLAFTIKKVPPTNAILQTDRDYRLLKPILAEGKPVLLDYEHWQPNFIEEHIIAAFTGKKGKRTPREDHVISAILREHARMAALFVDDPRMVVKFKNKDLLTRTGYTVYQFTPPSGSPDAPPAAIIRYGRKLHAAKRLPSLYLKALPNQKK